MSVKYKNSNQLFVWNCSIDDKEARTDDKHWKIDDKVLKTDDKHTKTDDKSYWLAVSPFAEKKPSAEADSP